MRISAKKPILTPPEFCREIESLSKAALIDLAWDFATTAHGAEDDVPGTMELLRRRMHTIQEHRLLGRWRAWEEEEHRAREKPTAP